MSAFTILFPGASFSEKCFLVFVQKFVFFQFEARRASLMLCFLIIFSPFLCLSSFIRSIIHLSALGSIIHAFNRGLWAPVAQWLSQLVTWRSLDRILAHELPHSTIFVVLAYIISGFNQHYQASVHFP